ncbi:MAG: IS66 family transposase [Chloroflexi bacterium]|nr:IS66 family transposase [Chloroflexota bacterium]
MDPGNDLSTADRDVLIGIIVRQQAIIESLEQRIAQLEGRAKSKGSGRMPGLKPKAVPQPDQPRQPRKPRRHGFARTRMTPTQRVEHAVAQCPDCGTQLSGGWTQRTREVIDLPQVPVEVTEHAYIARTCPQCQRCCMTPAQLDGVALDRQRLGINLVSLIAALREEARLPLRTIQWYLDTVHGLHLSVGAIVDATRRVAQKAQAGLADILERVRGSPVLHADETGWREDGRNGYVWTFSALGLRYFLRRGRGKAVVDEILGEEFAGVLVSDFYAAYHHYDGPKQRCWAHLLRDIHDLRVLYPEDGSLAQWADAVYQLYRQATALTHPSAQQRRIAQLTLEQRLLALCRPYLNDPYLNDPSAAQARLCRRMASHIKELFVFVAEPEVPPDNNAAERSLRPVVISRKISGGTRSPTGTQTKMTVASIFGTWRAQNLNTLTACRQLLAAPQV